MNKAIYGKTMGNLRNRVNVKLVNNKKDYLKCSQRQAVCRTKYMTII